MSKDNKVAATFRLNPEIVPALKLIAKKRNPQVDVTYLVNESLLKLIKKEG